MKRFISAVALAAAILPSSAGASTTTNSTADQAFTLQGGRYHPAGFVGVNMYLLNQAGVASAGMATAPSSRFEAQAEIAVCDISWNCSFLSFPAQTISPTAFSMDPAGNSGTFRACLLPSSGSCRTFDITITRPGFTATQCPSACVYPNAWYDPTTGTAGGNVFAFAGVYRQSYAVAGTFGGAPPVVVPSNAGMSIYTFSVTSNATSDGSL